MIKNKLLSRQLRKLGLSDGEMPKSIDQLRDFLLTVEKTYDESDELRVLNENITDKATKEMAELYDLLEKKSQSEIFLQHEKLGRVIEAVPSIICWVNRQGQILGLNQRMSNFLHVSHFACMGRTFVELGKPDLDFHLRMLFDGTSCEVTTDQEFATQQQKVFLKLIYQRFADDQMAIIIGLDLTQEKIKEKELEEFRLKSFSSSRLAVLGEMAAGIAHEVNNPLAVISGACYHLKKKLTAVLDDDATAKLDKIQSTVFRINKIINSLRVFARDGEHDPFVSYSLNKIIDDTLDLGQQKLNDRGISVSRQGALDDIVIECRPVQLSQVFLNLINNSSYAIQDLDEKWITIEVINSDDQLCVAVTDSGRGIPDTIREKIFNPFFTTKEAGVGTGLGLSISMGIIKSHSGSFTLDDTSKNTRFLVTLPKKHSLKVAA